MQTSKTTGPFVRRSFPRSTIPPRFRPVSVNRPKTIEFLKKKKLVDINPMHFIIGDVLVFMLSLLCLFGNFDTVIPNLNELLCFFFQIIFQ